MTKNNTLSEQEIAQVTTLLSKLEPGFLPFDVFYQITRIVATPIVEVVPLRLNEDNKIEVLLLRREADDPAWPGQLHVPGTVIRSTDTPGSFSDALKRILEGELQAVKTTSPVFVRSLLHRQARGMEVSQIFYVEVLGAPKVGDFYNADNLPSDIVATQLDFIPDAISDSSTSRPCTAS